MRPPKTVSIKKPQLQVALDPWLRGKADRIAAECGISLAEVFRRALVAYEGKVFPEIEGKN